MKPDNTGAMARSETDNGASQGHRMRNKKFAISSFILHPSSLETSFLLPPSSLDLEGVASVLLVRLRSLGDTVLMTPVIAALRRWRPGLHISALVEDRFAAVLRHNPKLDAVLEVPWRPGGGWTGLSAKLAAVRQVRRRPYDLVINLHGGTTSLFYTRLARGRHTLGSEAYRYARLYGLRAPAAARVWQRRDLHTIENQLAPLKWLGIPVEPPPDPEVFVDPAARARVGERLDILGLAGRPFAVIHPTATLFTKQWDPGKFARLADHLAADRGWPVVLSVSPAERAVARQVVDAAATPPAVLDDLSLSELMALIERAGLFIGCDSGPAHVAAALRRKVVVIFGSSNAAAWRPWRTAHELVRSDLPCIPCPGYRCAVFGDPKCIRDISVETVAAAVDRLIK